MSNPPRPPPMAANFAVRMTYMSLFNQILDSSININCICKTTNKIDQEDKKQNSNKNIFDKKVNDFMSDEEEEETDENKSDVEMIDNSNETRLYDLDHTNQVEATSRSVNLNKICDLSCFENMRYVHFVLKNCFYQANEQNLSEKLSKFENLWTNFKFLSKYPKSCDYFGTTIFHYAAAENCYYLLKYSLLKYPDGVFCIDSKGMTPLMRAVQRNSLDCVKYLLNNTKSDLNGSVQSTYTPLWFAVSNGYNELAYLLLNYNASPSIVNKSLGAFSNHDFSASNGFNMVFQNEDSSAVRDPRPGAQNEIQQTYLFSPLRASIVYSRFEIMLYLLEFNANVYELFGATHSSPSLPKPSRGPILNSKSNEDYVNSLKFFHRQFNQVETTTESTLSEKEKIDYEIYLDKLNSFIDNPNVCRRMFVEFVKNIIYKINSNLSLVDRLYDYLNSLNKNTVDYLIRVTLSVEKGLENEMELSWQEYVNAILDFMSSLDMFLSLDPDNLLSFNTHLNLGNSRLKAMYHKNLLDYSIFLMEKYFKPKSLKELCRFQLRKKIFEQIKTKKMKYRDDFLNLKHQTQIIDKFGLPSNLKNYLLYKF